MECGGLRLVSGHGVHFGRGRHGLAGADDGDFLEDDGLVGFVVAVAGDAGDGFDYLNAGVVALAEERVVLVERVVGGLSDEELAAIGVGAAVGHGEAAGAVKVEGWIDLIVEGVARVAGTGAGGVATLDHEVGDDAMEDGAIEVALVVHELLGFRVGPVAGSFSELDEVVDGFWGLFLKKLAGDAAHGCVEDDRGAVGDGHGGGSGLGGVGNLFSGLGGLLGADEVDSRGGKGHNEGGDEKRFCEFHTEFKDKSCATCGGPRLGRSRGGRGEGTCGGAGVERRLQREEARVTLFH